MGQYEVIADGTACAETRIAVPAMHCAGCIAKIEKGLAEVSGIASARVNFSAKQVVIQHDPALDPPALSHAIERLGFEAHPLSIAADGAALEADETRSLLKAVAVAGFSMMNIMLLSVSVWSGADAARATCSIGCRRLSRSRPSFIRASILQIGLGRAQAWAFEHGCADFHRRRAGDRAQPV